MAYMNADTGAKIGFRPYAQTNPEGAAHLSEATPCPGDQLSGLGEYFFNRPFDPWELYSTPHTHDRHTGMSGLGQNHPFKPQAWQLHGLGFLGDGAGNAGDDEQVMQAVQELQSAGMLDASQAQSIIEGSVNFNQALGYDPTDQQSWLDLPAKIAAANLQLQSVETDVRNAAATQQGQSNPTLAAVAQQTANIRKNFESAVSGFVEVYRAVTGQVPPGLSGLGAVPILVWVAGAAVAIVGVYLAIQSVNAWRAQVNVNQLTAQTQATQVASTAATSQTLLQALAKAQAAGDTTTAQQILKTLAATGAQPQPASAIETWFMNNAKWIGIGAIALVATGPITRGLFGRR